MLHVANSTFTHSTSANGGNVPRWWEFGASILREARKKKAPNMFIVSHETKLIIAHRLEGAREDSSAICLQRPPGRVLMNVETKCFYTGAKENIRQSFAPNVIQKRADGWGGKAPDDDELWRTDKRSLRPLGRGRRRIVSLPKDFGWWWCSMQYCSFRRLQFNVPEKHFIYFGQRLVGYSRETRRRRSTRRLALRNPD